MVGYRGAGELEDGVTPGAPGTYAQSRRASTMAETQQATSVAASSSSISR